MTKKVYMEPLTQVLKLQQRHIICGSDRGVNTDLQEDEVEKSWSRQGNSWWDRF